MTTDAELTQLVGRSPDERLLDDRADLLPEGVGRPAALPQSRIRGRLVGIGATLTGLSLLGGAALAVFGVVELIAADLGAVGILALVLGVLLAGTHWGWVHVAEVTADSIEARDQRAAVADRTAWLGRIEPHARWEVGTAVKDDGSIVISRVRYQPVLTGERHFSFEREQELSERHSGDEPGAAVTERAELLRRQAAADTERERLRYRTAADAYESAMLERDDEAQRIAARRAASEALSERINCNLRDPPLVE